MMADAIFDIASLISDVTEEEAAEIFKPTSRRAPNFAAYLMLLNAQEIGQRKHVDLPKDAEKPEDVARDLRYNLNEAAKERTVWKTVELTEDEAAQFAANKKIDSFERPDGVTITRTRAGKWAHEVKEPVILRWKIDTQEVEREVTEDGKKVKKMVKVPTRMHYVSVATEAIRRRAPRASANGTENATDEQKPEGDKLAPMTDEQNQWASELTDDQVKGLQEHATDNAESAAEYNLYLRWRSEQKAGAPAS